MLRFVLNHRYPLRTVLVVAQEVTTRSVMSVLSIVLVNSYIKVVLCVDALSERLWVLICPVVILVLLEGR